MCLYDNVGRHVIFQVKGDTWHGSICRPHVLPKFLYVADHMYNYRCGRPKYKAQEKLILFSHYLIYYVSPLNICIFSIIMSSLHTILFWVINFKIFLSYLLILIEPSIIFNIHHHFLKNTKFVLPLKISGQEIPKLACKIRLSYWVLMGFVSQLQLLLIHSKIISSTIMASVSEPRL